MQTDVSAYLSRGPHPTTYEHFQWLADRNVVTIIDLQGNLKERLGGELEAVMEGFHGRVLWMPMSSFLPPSASRLTQVLNTILSLPGRTYVCCEEGVDRTGLVCAYYAVKVMRMSVEDAIAEMYNQGFHRFPYELLGWVKRLRKALA